MEQRKLTYLLLIIGLLTFFYSNLFSQERPDISSPMTISPISETNEEMKIEKPTNNTSHLNKPTEYGSMHGNAILGSLGDSSSYVIVPHDFLFNNQTYDGSIEMWIYPTDVSNTPVLISKGATGNQTFLLGISSSDSKLFFRIGSTVYDDPGSTTIPLNQWTHVAVTWTGGSNFVVSFYINGVLSGTTGAISATMNSNTDEVRIGGSQFWPDCFFSGNIDEVRFWDPTLTPEQVAVNRFVGLGDGYEADLNNALTNSTFYDGLISSWTFNTGGHAYDDFNDFDGTYHNCGAYWASAAGFPMPYNMVLHCPGGDSNYVRVPNNSVFVQNGAGSFEAWVYQTEQSTTHIIASKGDFDLFWGIRASIGNRQVLCINGNPQYENSDGIAIELNTWTHVAVTWLSSSGDYIVNFYVNGQKSGSTLTQTNTWQSNTEQFIIGGWTYGLNNNFKGYIDEFRMWDNVLTEEKIRKNMSVSGRNLISDVYLDAIWNFDGNLLNFSSTSGINGTFKNGSTNACRLSGYLNENTTAAYGSWLVAHPTTIFDDSLAHGKFYKSVPNKEIPDQATILDTINIPGLYSSVFSSMALFLHIQHEQNTNLDITLTAPNGHSVDVSTDNGSSSDNGYLTILWDGASHQITGTTLLAPWTKDVRPENPMGTMNNTSIEGNWILQIADDASSNTGKLIGWGVHFNGVVTDIEDEGTIPTEFALEQNYPNPFNPTTKIEYSIANAGLVELKIYNILGEEITTLVNEIQNPGKHTIEFNGIDLSSGVYFYRIT
ncbi:MAG: T9SS type A sorting domain-containing protein, partial [Ignavibacteriales bacterium]|nr:T9SS type A sorting domain-containing protein [Ignavibacteriales bacterium]